MFIDLELSDNRFSSDNRVDINLNHVVTVHDQKVDFVNGSTIYVTRQSIDKLRERMYKTKQERSNEPKEELLELFNKLHSLTGGKGRATFSLTREKKLKELLTKHRMTEDLLIKAATNIGRDAFLQGDNDSNKRYGDIDYLLRPDKAAKWSEEVVEKKKGMF